MIARVLHAHDAAYIGNPLAEFVAVGRLDFLSRRVLRGDDGLDINRPELNLRFKGHFARDDRESLGNNDRASNQGHKQPWKPARFRRVGFCVLSLRRHPQTPFLITRNTGAGIPPAPAIFTICSLLLREYAYCMSALLSAQFLALAMISSLTF